MLEVTKSSNNEFSVPLCEMWHGNKIMDGQNQANIVTKLFFDRKGTNKWYFINSDFKTKSRLFQFMIVVFRE